MNKIIIFVGLIVIPGVMFCPACSSEAAEENPIYIGWSSKDVTPERPVSLRGQYYTRISTGVQSPLEVTALAIESKGANGRAEQVVMLSCDTAVTLYELLESIRENGQVLC